MKILIIAIFLLSCNKNIKELVIKNKVGEEYWQYIMEDKDEELKKYLHLEKNKDIDINKEHQNGEITLTLAARYNSRKVINLLLNDDLIKEKIDLNATNSNGQTALIVSITDSPKCLKRNLIIKKLLSNGADANVKYGAGCNTLMLAIIECDISTIEEILNKDVDINAQNLLGETALILAIKNEIANDQREKIIELLLSSKSLKLNIQDNKGRTALTHLILKENYEALLSFILLRKEFDINIQDNKGKSPIMHSLQKGNYKSLYILLNEENLNLNIKDINNKSAIIYLLENFNENILGLFKNKKDLKTLSYDTYFICIFISEMISKLENVDVQEVYEFFKSNYKTVEKYTLQALIKFIFELTFKKIRLLEGLLSLFDLLITQEENFLENFLSPYTYELFSNSINCKNEMWINCFFNKWKNLNKRHRIFNLYKVSKEGQTILTISVINNFDEVIQIILNEINKGPGRLSAVKYIENADKYSKRALDYVKNKLVKKEIENSISSIEIDSFDEVLKMYYYLYKGEINKYLEYLKRNSINNSFDFELFQLKYLIENGFDTVILEILKSNLNLSMLSRNDEKRLIHYAAVQGKTDILCRILEKDINQFNAKDKDNNTPLMCLIESNLIEKGEKINIFKKILEKIDKKNLQSHINISNKEKNNLFSIACLKGETQIVKYLIELEDININLDINCMNDKNIIQNVLECLLYEGSEDKVLNKSSYLTIIKMLLEKKVKLGKYILNYILQNNNYITKNIYTILKNNKFNFEKYSKRFKEASDLENLHNFIKKGHINLVEEIMTADNESLFNLFSKENKTALHYSVPFPELLEKILKIRNINVNSNIRGYTPLVETILLNNLKSLRVLIKCKKVDINILIEDNNTPLMLALYNNQIEAAKIILERDDIRLYLKNKDNKTAFDIAILLEMREIAYKILSKNKENLVLPCDLPLLEKNQRDLIEEWMRKDPYFTYYKSLIMAAKKDYIELIAISLNKELIGKGYINNYFKELKDLAVEKENIEFLEMLIEKQENNVQSIFKKALKKGKLKIIMWALQKVVNFNIRDKEGRTALIIAADYGYTEIVKFLLKQEIKINGKNKKGWTALMCAADYGYIEIVKLLLEKGANVNNQAGKGWTALMFAVNKGNLEMAKLLLEKDVDINIKNSKGNNVLMIACEYGQVEIVKLLLEKNANMYDKNNEGWTALMFSARYGHLQVMKLLMKKSYDIFTKNNKNWTALMLAAEGGHAEILNVLLEKEANVNDRNEENWTALMCAADYGYIEIVRLLLEKNADVNSKNNKGWTALMLAAHKGYLEIMKLLLRKGANIDDINNEGWTPLLLSLDKGNLEIAELLIKSGANIESSDKEGWTALMLAAHKGYLEIVKLLLNKEVNVNNSNEEGWTALMLASYEGYLEIVKLLLEKEININDKNLEGSNALMIVCDSGNIEIVKLLIEKGTDINERSKKGWTALMRASDYGYADIVKLLLEKKADIYNEDDEGVTALKLALENEHMKIVEFIEKFSNNLNK